MPHCAKALQAKLDQAVACLESGGLIAYPTEGVFGLGCDPFNQTAVERLLALKQRPVEKGMICIASNWQQVAALTLPVTQAQMNTVMSTWPGAHTWVFPASERAPKWITGQHTCIALRVTAHPVISALCKAWEGPIVSTSANLAGQPPARTAQQVREQLPSGIDFIVPGEVGDLVNPTPITNVVTGESLRA